MAGGQPASETAPSSIKLFHGGHKTGGRAARQALPRVLAGSSIRVRPWTRVSNPAENREALSRP